MMEIQIELAVILIILFIFITWSIWFRLSLWIAKRRYKPDNDKGQLGEQRRREQIARGNPELNFSKQVSTGFTEPESGKLFQATTTDNVGENLKQSKGTDGSNKKPGRSYGKTFRNPFRRRR